MGETGARGCSRAPQVDCVSPCAHMCAVDDVRGRAESCTGSPRHALYDSAATFGNSLLTTDSLFPMIGSALLAVALALVPGSPLLHTASGHHGARIMRTVSMRTTDVSSEPARQYRVFLLNDGHNMRALHRIEQCIPNNDEHVPPTDAPTLYAQ